MTTLSGTIILSKRSSLVDEFGLTHTIAYAAQSPWLRHQTIKENILFGYPYDEARYDAVVEACALKPDLDVLEDGDATEIGARSVIARHFFLSVLPADIGASLVEELACLAARRLGTIYPMSEVLFCSRRLL
jgi:hypothetical protein